MHRYSSASSNAGNSLGGPTIRDNSRVDSSFQPPNYPVNSRRQSQIPAYKLKCDREPLNSRLGPPDFYPQTLNCPEETLTREYLQSGYKETVEGIEEAREIVLSQVVTFLKPELIGKCREAIRKRFRAINESRAQKRKAGQVYGVPLSGHLLVRPGAFPEQKPSGEDIRRRWIEALSQPHKRLRSLSEHVPHGFRRKSLFDIITRHNIPLVRATWFVKVTYLNQVRNVPNGAPEKSQFLRTEQWTKDVADYFEQLLEEFSSKDGATLSSRDQPSPGLNSGHSSSKLKTESSPSISDTEEPSFNFKWWYMVRLVQWHLAEGLLLPSILIDRILNQLQDKDSFEILELLLPLFLGLLDYISLSQTYTRTFVEIAVRYLSNVLSSGSSSVDGLRRASMTATLAEMLRYLILSVPDTFVSLDCFPLPAPVAPEVHHRGASLKNVLDVSEAVQFETQDAYFRYLSCGHAVSSIEKRASDLAKIVNPNLQGRGAAKVVQALDKAIVSGNLTLAYSSLFEDLSDSLMEERWISEVSPCLQSSLIWIGTVELSLICSVFFLCEWATCDYRDCRTAMPSNLTGRKDLSQIYMAVLLLKNKMDELCKVSNPKSSGRHGASKTPSPQDHTPNQVKNSGERKNKTNMLESPGPLHDIIVCWLDQHEVSSPAGYKRVDALVTELICTGIFYPQAYVRQLIVSGLMDREGTPLDAERKRRHHRILKQLPALCLLDVLEESRVVEKTTLNDTVAVYSSERHLVVRELSRGQGGVVKRSNTPSGFPLQKQNDHRPSSRDGKSEGSKVKAVITELKGLISTLLHFPNISLSSMEPKSEGLKGSIKRPLSASDLKADSGETKQGCEECRRAKKQKIDNRSPSFQSIPSSKLEDEDIWWVRKGAVKAHEPSFKVELPQQKVPKQGSRGRRKTQSLAQLAAARIESSQGASTSHVCDNKVSCPHHKSTTDSDSSKEFDRTRAVNLTEIGKVLKRLRMIEKKSVSIWLLRSLRQLIEGNETVMDKPGSSTSGFPSQNDERCSVRWRMSEDELLSVMYVLDQCCDLVPLVKFLVWLLPKIRARVSANIQVGRHAIQSKNRESQICQVEEAFIYSALQRYENVLLATDLLPEVLAAVMHRNAGGVMPNGRHPCSAAFAYTRYILKKYRDVASVARWEKNFRATSDQRLLSELDTGRSIDGDSITSSGVSSGEDIDDHIRQKLGGRSSRNVPNMKEIVNRSVEEASRYFYGKERKVFTPSKPQGALLEKWDDSFQIAHDIVLSLGECIRQNCSTLPEGDPSVVAAAVSAIVGNVGQAIAKLPDFTSGNYQNPPSTATSLNCVRHILNIHIASLFLLKESLGDRLSRVFEVVLAVEACSAFSAASAPTKTHRNQCQPSPDSHDIFGSHSNDLHSNPTKGFVSRPTKIAAAVSALILGAVIHGVVSLDRLITVFRLKEGLDTMQFVRNTRSSNTNGVSRSSGAFKLDCSIEVYVHWFRLLIGNCRTVCDGLVCEILGESYILALSRMQRMLPLGLILPPAYSIFAMVIWKPYITNNGATREDGQLYQYLSTAVGDAITHQPFRDVCFRNTHSFYDILASDSGDSEFAALLELHGSDKHLRATAFIPLRARLFLNALIECKMPASARPQEDGSRGFESSANMENEAKLHERLLHILDTLQPAKFHWQWVELRLLLHEQALIEKIETQSMSFVEALRSLTPNADSESEKKFTEIIISRLLVRPDAASLYSEVVHLLGKLLQESLVMDTKWILQGPDVLQGRKSIRQQLLYVAHRKGLSAKAHFWKPWGWSCSSPEASTGTSNTNNSITTGRGTKRKIEIMPIEEGEVIDEFVDVKRSGKSSNNRVTDSEGPESIHHRVTEKALTELMLPCIDRSSSELRNAFAAELIKQMGAIEMQIGAITHNNNGTKQQANTGSPGIEGAPSGKSTRKGMRGGSPVIGRRPPVVASDSSPPPVASLRSALWVRLQFLIRLLPVIYADRDPSGRNMRQTLAGIILRLLGARVVYEEADLPTPMKREAGSYPSEALFYSADSLSDRPGEGLFDRLVCVLHALLGSCKPSWLKPKLPPSKATIKSPRDFPAFDREAAENLQSALDKMELPLTIRRRIQSAMPYLPPTRPFSLPCLPPLSLPSLPFLLPGNPTPGHQQRSINPSTPSWNSPNLPSGRGKAPLPSQEPSEMEIDPWTLLEDGTAGSSTSTSGSGGGGGSSMGVPGGDHSNLKASSWLKGAVRVRRADLTYIGSLDDDS
ncbi:RNA polymerase II transcription mediator isoform X2 [Carex rostrata]